MATTSGLSENPTIKPLLSLIYVLIVVAFVEAFHTSYYLYRIGHWRSLVLEVIKIAFLLLTAGISLSRRLSGDEGVPTRTSLRLGILVLLISAVSDIQYFHNF